MQNSVDLYNAVSYTTYLPLGGLHLTAGANQTNSLTITVTGKDANSSGFQVGIGGMTLVAVNDVSADSFANAMNNRGITTDNGGLGADFDGSLNGWSAQAMTTAGIAPGNSFTTSGATFTIPTEGTYTPDGPNTSTPVYDNVITYGQTIPLTNVQASAVGFLVASSCGWSPEARTVITYTDGSTNTPLFPTVPDWIFGDSSSATVTTPYIDYSAGLPAVDRQAHLYAVFLPADPTKTLASVTLPYTGTAQLDNTCDTGSVATPELHVFAIAPRLVSNDAAANNQTWLGAWSAPTDAAVLPPGGSQLSGQTLRMIVHPTSAGDNTRIHLSNLDTDKPVTITAASIAAQSGTSGTTAGALATPVPITFGSKDSIQLPVGGDVTSDPVAFPSTNGGSGNLLVSLYLANGTDKAPVHTTPTASTFVGAANDTANTDGSPFTTPVTGDYYLTGLDVSADPGISSNAPTGTVAVLGDQTAEAGATGGSCGGGSSYACTWVDDLAATPNAGIPGTVVNNSRAGTPPQDQWKLNDGAGPTAADAGGTHPATASGGVTWNTDASGSNAQTGSVTLDGSTGALATAGPVINTQDSFTISAWVNPTQLNGNYQTFLVQEATTGAGFYLEYVPTSSTGGVWSFSRAETDSTNPVVDRAESSTPAAAKVWTYLLGTFNESTGAMDLYVNGSYAGTATDNTPIAAAGPLVIGHGYFNGAANNFVDGSVANVSVYQRVLNSYDALNDYNSIPTGQNAANPGAASAVGIGAINTTGIQALPNSPSTILGEDLGDDPNLRTVIVSLGTTDILNGTSVQIIEDNLKAIISSTRSFGLDNLRRSDASRVQVLLTTIPPLGLPTTDPREQAREKINNDVINSTQANFNADAYIDFDGAVANSPANGEISPVYLTNGQPNAGYYQALANAVIAIERRVPPSTL